MDTTDAARSVLADLETMMAGMPEEHRNNIIAYRAQLDGWAVQLREAGWTQGQVGALVLDSVLNTHHVDRKIGIPLAMAVLA